MNTLNKRMYALLLTVTVAATNAYGMEADVVASEQQNEVAVVTAWYKTRQAKIAAAAATCLVVGYAIAVRMNKVSSPTALLAALFALKGDKTLTQNTNSSVINNNGSTDTNGGSSTPAPRTDNVPADQDKGKVSGNQGVIVVDTNTDNGSVEQSANNTNASEQAKNDNNTVVTLAEDSKNNAQIAIEYLKELKNTGVQTVYGFNPAMFDSASQKVSKLKTYVVQQASELSKTT